MIFSLRFGYYFDEHAIAPPPSAFELSRYYHYVATTPDIAADCWLMPAAIRHAIFSSPFSEAAAAEGAPLYLPRHYVMVSLFMNRWCSRLRH